MVLSTDKIIDDTKYNILCSIQVIEHTTCVTLKKIQNSHYVRFGVFLVAQDMSVEIICWVAIGYSWPICHVLHMHLCK